MSAVVDSAAHAAAADRLEAARGSIYEAFDGLGVGFDHEEAVDYMMGSLWFQSLPEKYRAMCLGSCMGFALTVVESDRASRE